MALSKQTHPSSELPVSEDRKTGVNFVKSLIQSQTWGSRCEGGCECPAHGLVLQSTCEEQEADMENFGLVMLDTTYLTAKRHR